MSVSQIGAIEAATLFAPLLTSPLWGVLSDTTRQRKLVTNAVSFLSLGLTALLLLPDVGCIRCFWSIASVLTGVAAFGGNSEGAIAAYTLDFLGPRRITEYGKVRMFASIGWGTSAVIIGLVTQHFGFRYNIYGYLTLGVAQQLLQLACLPRRTPSEERRGRTRALARWGDLCRSMCRWRVAAFLVEYLCLSFGVGVVERLVYAYIQHSLGASATISGLGIAAMSSLNIPLFFLSPAILRVVGRSAMFAIALAAYAIRVELYTRLNHENVACFVPIELLHGLTFSLMRAAVVDFTQSALPDAWLTTGQYAAVALGPQGLGGGLGALLGGMYMRAYGGKQTYALAALAAAAVLAAHLIVSAALVLAGRPPLLGEISPPSEDQCHVAPLRTATDAERLVHTSEGNSSDHPRMESSVQPAEAVAENANPTLRRIN